MKKGTEVTGEILKVRFPNKGILETEQGRVIVKNVIPGQKVRARINKVRKGVGEALLLSVEAPSPLEQAASCSDFGICGGCSYLTLPYEKQLELKESQVKELLEGRYEEECIWDPILPSPVQKAYRNKMEYSFGDQEKNGPLTLGLHRRGSFYDIVPVRNCQLVTEDFSTILQGVEDYFRKENATYFKKMTHEGFLRHLVLRRSAATGEILLNLVTSSQGQLKEEEFLSLLLGLPLQGKFAGILHTINDSFSDVVACDSMKVLYGKDYYEEKILGQVFQVSAFSFFQTNTLGAQVLYEKARELVGDTKGKVIFDLYSGTGTIGQMLAPVAKQVVGIEIVEEAVMAARENAKRNGLTNCKFLAGDVFQVLEEIEDIPDLIVLDPPRDGLSTKALKKIVSYQVPEMIYISCKPTSLARDLEAMKEAGYYAKRIVPVDQFPSTVHVETVVLLSRKDM